MASNAAKDAADEAANEAAEAALKTAAGPASEEGVVKLQRPHLQRWLKVLRHHAMAHDHLAGKFRYRARCLTLVEVVLNAIVTSAIFSSASESTSVPEEVRLAAGVLSLSAAVLAGLKSALNYDQRYEQHRAAALRFSKLWTRFEDLHSLRFVPYSVSKFGEQMEHKGSDLEAQPSYGQVRTSEWNDWFKDYQDTMEAAPSIDDKTWQYIKRAGSQTKEDPWWLCFDFWCFCLPDRFCCCLSQRLPPGWTEYYDEETKRPYYHRQDDDTVTYIRPKTEKAPPAPPFGPLPSGWTEYYDEESKRPYYHKHDHDGDRVIVTYTRPKTDKVPPDPPLRTDKEPRPKTDKESPDPPSRTERAPTPQSPPPPKADAPPLLQLNVASGSGQGDAPAKAGEAATWATSVPGQPLQADERQ